MSPAVREVFPPSVPPQFSLCLCVLILNLATPPSRFFSMGGPRFFLF